MQGTCSKSHGMNVAKLAGLPDSVVRCAIDKSEEFENTLREAHRYVQNKKYEYLCKSGIVSMFIYDLTFCTICTFYRTSVTTQLCTSIVTAFKALDVGSIRQIHHSINMQ